MKAKKAFPASVFRNIWHDEFAIGPPIELHQLRHHCRRGSDYQPIICYVEKFMFGGSLIMVDSAPFNLISAKTVTDLRIAINDLIRFTFCGVGDSVITTLGRYGSHDLLRLKHIIDYETLNEIVPEDPEMNNDDNEEEGESSVISWAVETSGVGVLKIGCLMSLFFSF
ncbi:hypothetical protein niasHT_012575 [Heterodera trifolii]|uniref:Uncharacterized protein n=1 Tax=Heterodera trifolii TaxID=157864 RepID=A0ABD2L1D1_9BILA